MNARIFLGLFKNLATSFFNLGDLPFDSEVTISPITSYVLTQTF